MAATELLKRCILFTQYMYKAKL